jgi:hypothetical protein
MVFTNEVSYKRGRHVLGRGLNENETLIRRPGKFLAGVHVVFPKRSFTRAQPPRFGTGFYRERNFNAHVTPAEPAPEVLNPGLLAEVHVAFPK